MPLRLPPPPTNINLNNHHNRPSNLSRNNHNHKHGDLPAHRIQPSRRGVCDEHGDGYDLEYGC